MRDLVGYQGKRVLISGCHSGIGLATARSLLEQGAEVHGLDRLAPDLMLHSFTQFDLRERESIDSAVERIGGRIDALFNCAGIPPGPPAIDVIKVNFIGTRYLTERALPLMRAGGAIASVASHGGAGWSRRIPFLTEFVETRGYEEAVAWCEKNAQALAEGYSFSKEALILWTLLASHRLIQQGLRINATSPGAVQTPMLEEIERTTPSAVIDVMTQPIGRRSSPEEQAYPLLMLNSGRASYINGVILSVDGGFMSARTLGKIESPAALGRR
jgi:NAD(P)-dependent dehydrogenase (short-subunit alcohol dehydrogenase family)